MQRVLKSVFDYIFALILLLISLPLIFFLIIVASISTNKWGVFSQTRVGQDGKLFKIYKIRSMYSHKGDFITSADDYRITTFGKFIRRTKLDELPQLYNILRGEMSFVGPRPDVPGYADRLQGGDRIILSVKPGITGPATVLYKDEEYVLSLQLDKEIYNDQVIWPNKVKINREYLENWNIKNDFVILYKTFI